MPPEVGLEPTTPRTLVRHSNHLSYLGGPVLTTTYRLYTSVGRLTLGWGATQYKSTTKDVISKLDLIKGKGIDVEIKWTPGHVEIKGNVEADKLAKEASKEAELMTDEGTCSSQPELKQAVKTHGLTVWQRQWDISDKGRFLHQLKPKVTMKTLFDFTNRKLHNLE